MDIATLRKAYLCGQTSPMEQVERCLTQRQDPDWAVLWITSVNADRLRQQARQLEEQRRAPASLLDSLPLYGVLFAVKDNIDVAGMPTTAGCPAFAYTPERSAPVVERLEAAGAILWARPTWISLRPAWWAHALPMALSPTPYSPPTSRAAPAQGQRWRWRVGW